MDFRIGSPPPVGTPAGKPADSANPILEAKVLAVRSPRRRQEPPRGADRRDGSTDRDPAGGRVLVLLVPEGYHVPKGLESGSHRVFVRFVRR